MELKAMRETSDGSCAELRLCAFLDARLVWHDQGHVTAVQYPESLIRKLYEQAQQIGLQPPKFNSPAEASHHQHSAMLRHDLALWEFFLKSVKQHKKRAAKEGHAPTLPPELSHGYELLRVHLDYEQQCLVKKAGSQWQANILQDHTTEERILLRAYAERQHHERRIARTEGHLAAEAIKAADMTLTEAERQVASRYIEQHKQHIQELQGSNPPEFIIQEKRGPQQVQPKDKTHKVLASLRKAAGRRDRHRDRGKDTVAQGRVFKRDRGFDPLSRAESQATTAATNQADLGYPAAIQVQSEEALGEDVMDIDN